MITIPFPPPDFRIQKRGEQQFIFDGIRKRWIVLTEEEWVRQNFVTYLVEVLQYPKQTIAIEKAILVNGLNQRFDIVVYDNEHRPWMLIECKAPNINLNENVLQQALRYHMALPVNWIVITNGNTTIGWQKVQDSLTLIHAIPQWSQYTAS